MDADSARNTIRVLVVDDSAVCREALSHLLRADPRVQVVGAMRDGASAIEALPSLRPDVITMDINMPGMDGYEATRRIMETTPTPIVVVSAAGDTGEVSMSFRAVESGAVAVVPKPRVGIAAGDDEGGRELVSVVKLMAEVKVVRRWRRGAGGDGGPPPPMVPPARPAAAGARPGGVDAVLIGASTGGPVPVRTILAALPQGFPAAVLVVQHIAAGFTEGFAGWLAGACRLPVRLAADGEPVVPGRVYVAPDGAHMGVADDRRIRLGRGELENGLRPSVSHLFRTAVRAYGDRAVGVLLSGMGRDGSAELKTLRDIGATTYAQSEETCVVFGMPGEAVRLGGASFTLSPGSIAQAIAGIVAGKAGNGRAAS